MRRFILLGPVVAIATLAVACTAGVERDAHGSIVGAGGLSVFSMQVGDCFDDPPGLWEGDTEFGELPGLPCSEPHDNEVFHIFNYPASSDAPFPGDAELLDWGLDTCIGAFESYVGTSYLRSRLDVAPLIPTIDSWEDQGDREIVCGLYDLTLAKLVGSMKDSGQ